MSYEFEEISEDLLLDFASEEFWAKLNERNVFYLFDESGMFPLLLERQGVIKDDSGNIIGLESDFSSSGRIRYEIDDDYYLIEFTNSGSPIFILHKVNSEDCIGLNEEICDFILNMLE